MPAKRNPAATSTSATSTSKRSATRSATAAAVAAPLRATASSASSPAAAPVAAAASSASTGASTTSATSTSKRSATRSATAAAVAAPLRATASSASSPAAAPVAAAASSASAGASTTSATSTSKRSATRSATAAAPVAAAASSASTGASTTSATSTSKRSATRSATAAAVAAPLRATASSVSSPAAAPVAAAASSASTGASTISATSRVWSSECAVAVVSEQQNARDLDSPAAFVETPMRRKRGNRGKGKRRGEKSKEDVSFAGDECSISPGNVGTLSPEHVEEKASLATIEEMASLAVDIAYCQKGHCTRIAGAEADALDAATLAARSAAHDDNDECGTRSLSVVEEDQVDAALKLADHVRYMVVRESTMKKWIVVRKEMLSKQLDLIEEIVACNAELRAMTEPLLGDAKRFVKENTGGSEGAVNSTLTNKSKKGKNKKKGKYSRKSTHRPTDENVNVEPNGSTTNNRLRLIHECHQDQHELMEEMEAHLPDAMKPMKELTVAIRTANEYIEKAEALRRALEAAAAPADQAKGEFAVSA